MNNTRKFLVLTMLLALAIVINMFENSFIPELPFGIRFGLANIISLIVINIYDKKELFIINILRVVLANLIGGTLFDSRFLIGFGGIVLSTFSLLLTKKIKSTIIFSSIISSLAHTLGQIIVVCFIYNSIYMINAIPIYIISSIGTGVLTGIISFEVLKRIRL